MSSKNYLDKNGLTYFWGKVKSYVSGMITQSDWNEEDSSASDYVKNKPFYLEEFQNSTVCEDSSFSTDRDETSGKYYCILSNNAGYADTIYIGGTANLVLNDVSYSGIVQFNDEYGNYYVSFGLSGYNVDISSSGVVFYSDFGSASGFISLTLPSADLYVDPNYQKLFDDSIGDIPVSIDWENFNEGQVLGIDWNVGWTNIDVSSSGTPDWSVTDTTDRTYIANKPSVKAGSGTNGVVVGMIENDSNAVIYTLYLTGSANVRTYSYTTQDTLPSSALLKANGYIERSNGNQTFRSLIESIDTSNHTITLINSLDPYSAISSGTASIYYKYGNVANNTNSYAEGKGTRAFGSSSHAEGLGSLAHSNSDHAEGYLSTAAGGYSHAEGRNTYANGIASHAEGSFTRAIVENQHVQGKYNIEDTSGTYAHIVGNGNASTPSNAHTLDWNGNGWYAGKLTVGTAPTNTLDVATKGYVDTAVSGVSSSLMLTATVNNTTVTFTGATPSEVYAAASGGALVQATIPLVWGDGIFDLKEYAYDSSGGDYYFIFSNVTSDMGRPQNRLVQCSLSTGSATSWTGSLQESCLVGASIFEDVDGVFIDDTTLANNQILRYDVNYGSFVNADAPQDNNTTYTISISGNVITLTPSSGQAQSITLPVYNGGVA